MHVPSTYVKLPADYAFNAVCASSEFRATKILSWKCLFSSLCNVQWCNKATRCKAIGSG